jgi:hypothetical protein
LRAVGAFALDQRLDGAELVDAALDDLDRLVDRLAYAIDDRRLAERQAVEVAVIGDVDIALAGRAHDAAERLRQGGELFARLARIAAFTDAHLDAVAAHDEAGIADARVAQHAADVVAQSFEHVLADGLGIDLEEDVRSALQVETENDVALRPFRPGVHHRRGQEIRNRAQADDERRKDDRRRLPPRKIQHDVLTSEADAKRFRRISRPKRRP